MLHGHSTRKLIGLQIVTLGFYFFRWAAVCRKELNTVLRSNYVPTTWFLIIPGLNYWWMWHYSHALDGVTNHSVKYSDTFLLYIIATTFLSFAGYGYSNFSSSTNDNTFVINDGSWQTAFVLLVAALIVFVWIVSIVANTFYICVMQKRTDKAKTL